MYILCNYMYNVYVYLIICMCLLCIYLLNYILYVMRDDIFLCVNLWLMGIFNVICLEK